MKKLIALSVTVTILAFAITAFVLAATARHPARTNTVSTPVSNARQPKVAEAYGKLPLMFEENHGQMDKSVRFLSRGGGYSLFLTPTESVLALRGPADALGSKQTKSRTPGQAQFVPTSRSAVVRMKLLGSNPRAAAAAFEELPGKTNYLIGNDPKQWRTNVPNYGKVRFTSVYPGVDLVYYGNQRQLEYDFVVAPGANPSAITLGFEGAERMQIDSQGELAVQTSVGDVRWHKPVLYQEMGGVRQAVDGRYVAKGNKAVGFEIASYDPRLPLIIDPVLVYSTYLGSSGGSFDGNEVGFGIAVDSSGNAYVAGESAAADFSTTAGAFQPTFQGFFDAFVTKLNAAGTAMVYSTYVGGSNQDGAHGIAVDSLGNAYITGFTRSSNFPIVNAFQAALSGGQNAFVTELNAAGNALVYSTYLGGSGSFFESGLGVAVDSSGYAYVTGATRSPAFPTRNAFQTALKGPQDAFIARLDTTTSGDGSLVYSTYLGGNSAAFASDQPGGIATDSVGNAYVVGSTDSVDFPATSGAFQPTLGLREAAYVAKVDTNASGVASLVYSTFLGGSAQSEGHAIALDSSGNAYVTGYTTDLDFPTTTGAFQQAHAHGGGVKDAFVAKLNQTGTGLVYSTYLGGSGDEEGDGIALDSSGDAYVTGITDSTDFPTINAIQAALAGGFCCDNAFVTELNAAGSSLLYSTYLGGTNSLPYSSVSYDKGFGIAVDACGTASVTGLTQSTDFPTVHAIQSTRRGSQDAFVAKIGGTTLALASISLTPANPIVASGAKQQFTATGTFTDCSTRDLTSSVTWGSDTPGVATITGGGLASGIGTGTSLITASSGGISGSMMLRVTNSVPAIDYTMSASPQSLALIASSMKTSGITLRSRNGISEMVNLTATWVGATPVGATVAPPSQQVSVPSTSPAVATFTVTTSASPSPGTFTLRITGTSSSGVMKSLDLSVVIAATLPAPTCGCTKTGAFKDPRVKGLVAPTPSGDGPNGLATVTANSGLLTLTRNSADHKIIVNGVNNVSDFGFSPNGKFFVLITSQQSPSGGLTFLLSLYSIPAGGLVSPINSVTNALSWGFSPDDENRYFLMTSSEKVNTHVLVTIFDTSNGAQVMQEDVFGYSSVPMWTGDNNAGEDDVDNNDAEDNKNTDVGGWGFSPDGNTFVLSYLTTPNQYSLYLFNLTQKNFPVRKNDNSPDVASFWQFSPCGDLFMLVDQAGANPSPTDSVTFYFTSNGDTDKTLTLAQPLVDPSATVVTETDGSKQIDLVGMNLPSIASPQCSIQIVMNSPANIVLIDGSGRRIGFDPLSGGIVNEIPGGSYTGPGSEPQTVTIPYVAGTYLLEAFGLNSLTGPASYRLTFATADASGDVFDETELFGTASRGSEDVYVFTVGNGPLAPIATSADVTPPDIHCASPDGQWHASDVSLVCTATDAQSGLANPADASFTLSTQVLMGVETNNASTGSRQICDAAGNCAVAPAIAGNKVDKKGPSIAVTVPAGNYVLGQTVLANYSCTDGGSGVASCAGTVASGAAFDTTIAGSASFVVNAADNVGNRSSATTGYTVTYNINLLYPLRAKQSGSTYPIKLQLSDASGRNVSNATIVVHAVGVIQVSNDASVALDDSGDANADMDFRYDASLAGYIFNLSLSRYQTGTYYLQFTAGNDPTVHMALFEVK